MKKGDRKHRELPVCGAVGDPHPCGIRQRRSDGVKPAILGVALPPIIDIGGYYPVFIDGVGWGKPKPQGRVLIELRLR